MVPVIVSLSAMIVIPLLSIQNELTSFVFNVSIIALLTGFVSPKKSRILSSKTGLSASASPIIIFRYSLNGITPLYPILLLSSSLNITIFFSNLNLADITFFVFRYIVCISAAPQGVNLTSEKILRSINSFTFRSFTFVNVLSPVHFPVVT